MTEILLEIGIGVLVGIASALFGIGGGIIMVPFMVLVLGLGQHAAQGTSLLVIVPTALLGVALHRRAGYVAFGAAGLLGIGGVLGALLGASVALGIGASDLRTFFGVLVVAFGIRTILSARAVAGE